MVSICYYRVGCCLLLWSVAWADLPIHCTQQDAVGDWTFHMGPAEPMTGKIPSCGHRTPNSVTSMVSINRTKVLPLANSTEFKVTLTEDIQLEPRRHLKAVGGGAEGSWTMIFDTGFEIRAGGKALAAHFLFEALPGATPQNGDNLEKIGSFHGRVEQKDPVKLSGDTYACYCDVTSTGWWHQRTADGSLEGGCLWGSKEGAVQKDGSLTSSMPAAVVSLHSVSKQLPAHSKGLLSTRHKLNGLANFGALPVDNASEFSREVGFQYVGVFKEVLRPNGATVGAPTDAGLSKRMSLRGVRAHRFEEENKTLPALPTAFDWREELKDMVPAGEDPLGVQIDQGACGSCYAFAAIMVLQMRFRVQLYRQHDILYPVELSYKSMTRCTPYTEGCSGGFSYLTHRAASEIGVPSAECDREVPASALDQTCDWGCYKNNSKLFFASDYWHVGGFSHGASEASIMREIYMNGPVELAFSTTAVPEFVKLSGNSHMPETDVMTIISNSQVKKETYSANPELHQWWYATHAILATGWGEDDVTWGTVKYWVVRNSWGRDWGVGGYAKMRRGNNDGGIETDAAAVTPDMTKLPPGFLEEAKQFSAKRRKELAASKDDAPKPAAAKVHKGLPDYCKERPDSIDCQ